MAAEQLLVVVVEVQAAAFAVAVHLAAGALSLTCPGAVAELLEALLPNLPDVVAVDIALREIAADTGSVVSDLQSKTYMLVVEGCCISVSLVFVVGIIHS